jgi:hypothetical protein
MSTDALQGAVPVGTTPGVVEAGASVLCHYCGILPGATVDHVVPRSLLPRAQRMLGMVTQNSVKACEHCNGRKSSFRVDCCESCLDAWVRWGPADWERTVKVVSKIWVAKKARALTRP